MHNHQEEPLKDVYIRPLGVLKGIGPQTAEKFKAAGISTIHDLVFTLPIRYADKTKLTLIENIRPGDTILLDAIIEKKNFFYLRKRSLNCRVNDGTGALDLKFYYYAGMHDKRLNIGEQIRCYGKARAGRNGIEIIHPEYEVIDTEGQETLDATYTPIYKNIKGISQASHLKIISMGLEYLIENHAVDLVGVIAEVKNMMNLSVAIKQAHFPDKGQSNSLLTNRTHPSQRRIALEELIAYQLLIQKNLPQENGININSSKVIVETIMSSLPFEMTDGQEKSLSEILNDLGKDVPMNRLLQGDVGCGKTLVALLVAAYVSKAGYQAAIMAPTEILARQHYEEFVKILTPLNINIQFLSGSLSSEQKHLMLDGINNTRDSIVVGTHALFQEHIQFNNLGLVVVDEQHRFGVKQRLSLRKKRNDLKLPHQLFMTATPIPRTVAMTLFSDMTLSTIDELPKGRLKVETSAIPRSKKNEIIKSIERMIQTENSQVYWVSPIISESEHIDVEAAEDTYKEIKKMLPSTEIGLIHGKMSNQEKDSVMQKFKSGTIKMLVSTTLIEVGVNVPNATCMVIEGVERMGLSQIHQLRGRVGRGSKPSFCLLLYKLPLSIQVQERLATIRDYNDGFKIAEKDFSMRGPGNIFGIEQSGVMNFQIVDLGVHFDLVYDAKKIVEDVLSRNDTIADELVMRWYADSKEYVLA